MIKTGLNRSLCSRILPFVVFMGFIAIEEALRSLLKHQVLMFDPLWLSWLYIPKVLFVGFLLLYFFRDYLELNASDLYNHRSTLLSIISGVLVFILWINMDWTLGSQHTPAGFNPEAFSSEQSKWLMICARVTGAVIIVPIMEELFWRSFLLRYLIDSNFTKVAIGQFSLFSFLSVIVLFGLEHHYVFAGIMAGIIFNGICYYSRSIFQCILSHAVANLCLAYYVLSTGYWHFW